ncbi:unnamed protein product [Didymodactylos carnosus]|uniref:Uncharacterized protein n=1 Tax=Didymodactylos carnosus TaxID=1234261 RepID=A0A814MRS0_9BILA|nr:unnamed protein product [Didymodactylos carnosus]CAF1081635.1 unnamed protein product [Didymodactylos carnosus]CAF3840304.1 unnamed protein product [Didymodactylos carnosus]CAF3847352.1 unnamed protein product [Didymodactylos carnosus]
MLTASQHPTVELISSTLSQTISVGDILLHYGSRPTMITVNICKQSLPLSSSSQYNPAVLYHPPVNRSQNPSVLCDLKNIEEQQLQQVEKSNNTATNNLTTKSNIRKKAMYIPKVGWEFCKESLANSKLRKKLYTSHSKTNKKDPVKENDDITTEITNNEHTQL